MRSAGSASLLILGCVGGLFVLGMMCLLWPRRLQRFSVWWAELGMYPFPGFARSEAYVWVLRALGALCIGLTLFLLSGAF